MGIPKRSAEVMESLLRYGRGIKTTETNGPTVKPCPVIHFPFRLPRPNHSPYLPNWDTSVSLPTQRHPHEIPPRFTTCGVRFFGMFQVSLLVVVPRTTVNGERGELRGCPRRQRKRKWTSPPSAPLSRSDRLMRTPLTRVAMNRGLSFLLTPPPPV